ncbi:MAG: hypothetical protein ACK5L8_03655 [Marinicella pacifica]
MKHSIKLSSLIIYGVLLSGGSSIADNDIASLETKAPQGVTLNRSGDIVQAQTKTMVDENRPVGGTSIRYYSSSAAGMQVLSGASYEYKGAGCTAPTTFGISMDEAIDLPDGSKIVSFTVLGLDNSNTESGSGTLARVDNSGNYTAIAYASSGNTEQPGRFSAGEFVDHSLSSGEGTLVRFYFSDPVIELCGFRIGYVPPDVADDVIFVNNFYR